jgi:DNA-binding transcriptional LysR family regulator
MDNVAMDAIAVFVKVVEASSFSVAARRLGMPKTTVSAKVAGLEKRLGVRLIHRTTRKLRMTEAGEKYFHHCAIAIREVELAEAALQSTKGKPDGVLKVTAPVDLGHVVLPQVVRDYAVKYPDVSVELIITNRTVDLVAEGVDIAIRSASVLRDSSLIARRFFDARANLWASPEYLQGFGKPAHPRDLTNAAFVGNSAHKSVILTNGKSDFEVQMNGRVRADNYEAIKALTLLGVGIAWLPDFLAGDAAEAGTLVRILPQWQPKKRGSGTFYFVYAGHRYALPKVEGFIQTSLEHRNVLSRSSGTPRRSNSNK